MSNIITGHAAIDHADALGLQLNKYADPTEGPLSGISVDEAREIAAEDPSLIWVSADSAITEEGKAVKVRYQVKIPGAPRHSDEWCPEQNALVSDGITAASLDQAQEKLDALCRAAGTHEDPYYDDFGPLALDPNDQDNRMPDYRYYAVTATGDVVYRIVGERVWLPGDEDDLPAGVYDQLPTVDASE